MSDKIIKGLWALQGGMGRRSRPAAGVGMREFPKGSRLAGIRDELRHEYTRRDKVIACLMVVLVGSLTWLGYTQWYKPRAEIAAIEASWGAFPGAVKPREYLVLKDWMTCIAVAKMGASVAWAYQGACAFSGEIESFPDGAGYRLRINDKTLAVPAIRTRLAQGEPP